MITDAQCVELQRLFKYERAAERYRESAMRSGKLWRCKRVTRFEMAIHGRMKMIPGRLYRDHA